MRIITVTLSEPLNCGGLLISMFTQTKGLLFLLTFFFENRVKTKYLQMLTKCSNFWAIFIFGPLTIVLQKSIQLMTRIDQFALKIQKAKKYPWGETWDSKRSTESRISPLLSYFLSQHLKSAINECRHYTNLPGNFEFILPPKIPNCSFKPPNLKFPLVLLLLWIWSNLPFGTSPHNLLLLHDKSCICMHPYSSWNFFLFF